MGAAIAPIFLGFKGTPVHGTERGWLGRGEGAEEKMGNMKGLDPGQYKNPPKPPFIVYQGASLRSYFKLSN
jgi:hypothetical protein